MAAKRPSSQAGESSALFLAWRWHLRVSRAIHPKRYNKELDAFAPRIFGNAKVGWRIPDDEDTEAIDDAIARGSYTFHNLFHRSDFMAQKHNDQNKLDHPFTSSPQVPPTVGLYFYRDGRCTDYVCFAKTYGAKLFMDLVTEDQTISWISDNSLLLSPSDVTVTGAGKHDLETVMEHEFSTKEQQFILPAPYPQQALSIVNRAIPRPSETMAKPKIDEEAPQGAKRKRSGSDPQRPAPDASSRRSRRPSEDANTISIADIAQKLKINPREARSLLRKTDTPKPATGRWEWPQDEAAQIETLLRKAMA